MLLITAERMATVSMITVSSRASLSPATVTMRRPMASARPVFSTAPPTTNSAAMLSTAGFENPASASDVVRRPVSIKATTTPSATMSTRTHSVTNNTMAVTRMASAVHISSVMPLSLSSLCGISSHM